MKKQITLTEVREILGEKVRERKTSFLFSDFGKYGSDITYVLPKEFELNGAGNPLTPIRFITDPEVTDSLNLDFGGDASFIFGNFWRSKREEVYFCPKNPMQAKDLLIRVESRDSFSNCCYYWPEEASKSDGVKYFHRTSNNSGDISYDYWVFPVGFAYAIYDEEEVEDDVEDDSVADPAWRTKAYCEKHAKLQREVSEDNDRVLKAKLAGEESYFKARADLLSQAKAFEVRLDTIRDRPCYVPDFEIGDTHIRFGADFYLLSATNIAKIETRVTSHEEWSAKCAAEDAAREKAKAEFAPQFKALEERILALGWQLDLRPDKAHLFEPYKRPHHRVSIYGQMTYTFPFSAMGVLNATKLLEKKEAQRKML